jgi:hypothetical protein
LGWKRELSADARAAIWAIMDWEYFKEPLTPSAWLFLQPSLVTVLEKFREQRIAEEAETRVANALTIIQYVRTEYQRNHVIVPNVGDLFLMNSMQDAIFTVFNISGDKDVDLEQETERLKAVIREAAREHLHIATQRWVDQCKTELCALITAPQHIADLPCDLKWNLATTTFYLECDYTRRKTPMTPMQILASEDTIGSFFRSTSEPKVMLSSLKDQESRNDVIHFCNIRSDLSRHWACHKPIIFYQDFIPVTESLVRGCNLDPAVATHRDLALADGIFLCGHRDCYKPDQPLAKQTFILKLAAVRHWADHLNEHGSPAKLAESLKDTDYLLPVQYDVGAVRELMSFCQYK